MNGTGASALQRKVAAIVKRHCERRRANAGTADEYFSDSASIIHADRWAVKRQRAWKADAELARIEQIERLLDQVVDEINELPEALRLALHFDAEGKAAPEGSLEALKAIRSGVASAKAEASSGTGRSVTAIGRSGRVRAGAVLLNCRGVWFSRTGERAPDTINDARPPPFGIFAADVFDALGIGISVRQAMDLVQKQRRKKSHVPRR